MQNAWVDRGSVEIELSESESSSNEDNLVNDKRRKQIHNDEALFKKLKNNTAARSNCSSIHAARAHKYGHVQFGPKTWYKESVHISEELTSQEDRREFRQGLKCNVDFLNQLNMHDLMKTLIDGKQNISSLPKTVSSKLGNIFECLKDIPMLDILRLINHEKAQKIFHSIYKIVALAHVSQSMGNYFARDDSLEPALSIVCQGLRGNTDFEHILRVRGGTFQCLASAFYHFKSPGDCDLSGSTRGTRGRGFGGGKFRNPQRRPRTGNYCWAFQRNGRCSKRDCGFSHRCMRCGNKNHGGDTCKKK